MYDILIKNGKLVRGDGVTDSNIVIQGEKIAGILAKGVEPDAKNVIDAQGKFIFPGAIDTHAHLNDPGYTWREDFIHGTAAAAVGGYTTIIDMPLQNEPAMTNAAAFDIKLQKVESDAHVDFCFWGGLVESNFADLEELDAKGCVAFKSFIGPVSPDYSSLNYGQVYEAMEKIARFGGRAGFHCEDFSMIKWQEGRMQKAGRNDWRAFLDSRPVLAELIATLNVIEIARETGCKAHICHVSHPEVVRRVLEAQKEGIDITLETCTHYLSMTEEDVLEKGALFKCAPPLRTKEDLEKMWKYVAQGAFAGIGSDHSPCTYEEKFQEMLGKKIETVFDAWGGISGIQSGMQVAFYEGCIKRKLCPSVLAKNMAELPAKAFGIYGKKGEIKEGFDADILIVDPEKPWKITEDSLLYVNKLSAFVGMEGMGMPVMTMLRGQIIAENGNLCSEKARGRFVAKQR